MSDGDLTDNTDPSPNNDLRPVEPERPRLADPASFRLPDLMTRLRPLLAGEEVYLVGGAVRDALLGRASHDLDLAVPGDALALTFRLADQLGLPAFALDKERDVGRLFVPDEQSMVDVARYRGESLADDLDGRDFTINALALPATAESPAAIIDRHGGLADLAAGRIRLIHPRSIDDDRVRALRAVRMAVQLGFTLPPETAAAAAAAAPRLLERTSIERVRDELGKILESDRPAVGLRMLHDLGLLAVVVPEVAALEGVAQSSPHHEPVLAHTLSVLRWLVVVEGLLDDRPPDASEEGLGGAAAMLAPYRDALRAHLARRVDGGIDGRLALRLGGLFHDTGKRPTQTIGEDGRIRFLGHDEVGADLAAARLTRLTFSNEAVGDVRRMVAGHMRPLLLAHDGAPSRRAIYRYYQALGPSGLDVVLLSLADHLATYDGPGDEEGWSSLLSVSGRLLEAYFAAYEQTVAPERLLTGREIIELLAIPAGPEIGRLVRLLEEAQAAGEVGSRDEALAFLRQQSGQ